MNLTSVIFGSILFAAFVFYFVIKWAVKNAINESKLFADKQRDIQQDDK
ncbi:hypothetical protein FACS1894111_04340 [Clostridia bacterium]|nr:hypothetical protein FACS1894111_04340 [Clostridia bacterium]